MSEMNVNYLAVLVSGIATFMLGGLWYSPALFAKGWVALVGLSEEQMKAGAKPTTYLIGFVSGLISCFVLALVIKYANCSGALDGAATGALCWLGFAATTSYNNQVNFIGRPAALWVIDSGYNLVSFAIAGAILAVWK